MSCRLWWQSADPYSKVVGRWGADGVGCGEGVSSHGDVYREVAVPHPQKKLDFLPENAVLWCILMNYF